MKKSIKNQMFLFVSALLLCAFIASASAQSRYSKEFRKAYTAPDELISLSKTVVFDEVFNVFYDLSKKYMNRIIISDVSLNFEIGINIDKKHWLDAFEEILREHDLWYEQHKDFLKIVSSQKKDAVQAKKGEVTIDTREVVISAIFFEADDSKLTQLGFSWDFIRGSGVNLRASMTASDDKPSVFQVEASPDLGFGSLMAAFRALESDQVGDIVSTPQITVRSGIAGKIQVGSDVALIVKDFAGNAVNQFFSTGSIVEVTPEVIEHDSVFFVNLKLRIERSSMGGSTSRTEIKKSEANTSILLLDGEETVIGGLYVTEEVVTREGVPVLKDLPWWVLGIRYLFGYESTNLVKKELLIVIKADLVPTLKERLAQRKNMKNERLLQNKRKENLLKMKYYQQQLKKK